MPLTNKKAIEQERRKRKYERYKVKFAAKSTIEKERAIKIKQEEQRRYRIRLKQKTGYSSKQRARLQEIKILYNQGKSTYEQQEELRKDFLKRRVSPQTLTGSPSRSSSSHDDVDWSSLLSVPLDPLLFPSPSRVTLGPPTIPSNIKHDTLTESTSIENVTGKIKKKRKERFEGMNEEEKEHFLQLERERSKRHRDKKNKEKGKETRTRSKQQITPIEKDMKYKIRTREKQKRYRQKVKQRSGYTNLISARLAEYKRLEQAGKLTFEQYLEREMHYEGNRRRNRKYTEGKKAR